MKWMKWGRDRYIMAYKNTYLYIYVLKRNSKVRVCIKRSLIERNTGEMLFFISSKKKSRKRERETTGVRSKLEATIKCVVLQSRGDYWRLGKHVKIHIKSAAVTKGILTSHLHTKTSFSLIGYDAISGKWTEPKEHNFDVCYFIISICGARMSLG